MKNIFIIGSKGIPAKYGGFETFVDKLTEGQQNKEIKYHVACLSNENSEFTYNNARCFNVKVLNMGSAKAVIYDILALRQCISYIEENNITDAIIYILACRIGPFIGSYKHQLAKLGVQLFVNPDGHEWKRGKWSKAIRQYWKISENYMVKYADLLICDSKNIEKYIKQDYKQYNPKTTFIAYGADTEKSKLTDDDSNLVEWYKEKNIEKKGYYLVVGRFVPENNYETMITEFMKSNTKKDFILITNVEENKFYDKLKEKTNFDKDKRIKFVGTVYNQELLKKIRENAYGYFHGHEVGGTNPSLLEALATTDLNILLDVGFNKEVGMEGALYFNKEDRNLANLIEKLDNIDEEYIKTLGAKAKERIEKEYTWKYIIDKYEDVLVNNIGTKDTTPLRVVSDKKKEEKVKVGA
ncbi:DUF1972 domain-containing protein [Clostridium algoriphilum]|uniref:beta 1-4 rhamnosyltransferase Cps2T n=1 Tax=Clostridium algoriphilum TaxID=198347 RepID=UPI001CF5A7FA|nr:DUF1972 domain-containing protein [Clostridium algoriphilum]MCB2295324.1 DUF1972 domain-containing protein [Clostridium algoriphilum]